MLKRKRVSLVLSLAVIATMSLAGCSAKDKTPAASSGTSATPNNEPVTLKFYTMQNGNYAKEEIFDDEIGKSIKAKYPNIKIEHVHGAKYEEFIAAGEFPDIILETSGNTGTKIRDNALAYDLTDMIKNNKFDLARINPALIEQIKNATGDGKLYGLPFTGSNFILFYNKDLFDKFGIPYPKDGMTWDDSYDLAKKIARTEGDVTYSGFTLNAGLALKYNQLSLNAGDLKQNKAAVQTEDWKKVFDTYKRFYEIPSNPLVKVDDFVKGTLAMSLHISEKLTLWPQQAANINWDVISAPVFKDKPKVGFQSNVYSLYVTNQSKHKDQAFQVVSYLLSDEAQTGLSKKGYVTPLVSKEVQKVVGQDIAGLKGKNVQNAIYFNDFAKAPAARESSLIYVDIGSGGTIFDNMVKNAQDVNTTLRTWSDQIEVKIGQDAAKKK